MTTNEHAEAMHAILREAGATNSDAAKAVRAILALATPIAAQPAAAEPVSDDKLIALAEKCSAWNYDRSGNWVFTSTAIRAFADALAPKQDTPYNLGWSAGWEACKRANPAAEAAPIPTALSVHDKRALQHRGVIPVTAAPLTDKRLHDLFDGRHVFTVYEAARLVEQAHGIGTPAAPAQAAAVPERARSELLKLAENYARHLVAVDFWSGKVKASAVLTPAYEAKEKLETFAAALATPVSQAAAVPEAEFYVADLEIERLTDPMIAGRGCFLSKYPRAGFSAYIRLAAPEAGAACKGDGCKGCAGCKAGASDKGETTND